MSYKIETAFCWYENDSRIVKMYFIQGVPFTFDELPIGHLYDRDLIEFANKNFSYEPNDLYKSSFYLIDEEAHPCLFMMDIENPEDMPEEEEYDYNEEDLMG